MKSNTTGWLVGLLALALTVSCVDGAGPERRPVLVSAAASLARAFAKLESAFESADEHFDVILNLGGSSLLREQILGGAPADVFAPADQGNMTRIVSAGQVAGDATIFARNSMQVAVPAGNPSGVSGFEDLAREELLIGLCAAQVPCGALAAQVLEAASVQAAVDTREPNVRALLTKLEAGELDVGIVYATDILAAAGRVEALETPDAETVSTAYPIAVLTDAPNPDGATAFVAFVLSDEGQAILAAHGFESP